jgi:hypothetical protein
MPNAPEELRGFRDTITRDLYSFGLVMSYSLFSTLPYGSVTEEDTEAVEVQRWKLEKEPTMFLYDKILSYAPSLHAVGNIIPKIYQHPADNTVDPSSVS